MQKPSIENPTSGSIVVVAVRRKLPRTIDRQQAGIYLNGCRVQILTASYFGRFNFYSGRHDSDYGTNL